MKCQALLVAWVVLQDLLVASGFSVNRQAPPKPSTPLFPTNFPGTSQFNSAPVFSSTRLSSSSAISSSTRLSSSNSFLQDDILKLWTVWPEDTSKNRGTPPSDANGHRNGADQPALKKATVQSSEKERCSAAATSSFESFVQNQHSWNESANTTQKNTGVVATEKHPSESSKELSSFKNRASAAPEVSRNNGKEERSNSYTPYKASWKSEAPSSTPDSSPGEITESDSRTMKTAILADKTMSSGLNNSTWKSETTKDDNNSDLKSSSGESKTTASSPAASSRTRNGTAEKPKTTSFAPNNSSWKSQSPKANGMGAGPTREKLGAIETSAYPAFDVESPAATPFASMPFEMKSGSKDPSFDRRYFPWRDFGAPREDEDAIETSAYEDVETPVNTREDAETTVSAVFSASTPADPPDEPKSPIMMSGNTTSKSQSSSVEPGEQDAKVSEASGLDNGPPVEESKTMEMSSDTNASSKMPASSTSSKSAPNKSTQSAMEGSPSVDNSTSLVEASLYGFSSGSWRLVERLEARKSRAASSTRGTKVTKSGSFSDQTDRVSFSRKALTSKPAESVQSGTNRSSSGGGKTKSFRDLYASWKSADFKHLLGMKGDDGTIETSASEEKESNDSAAATEAPVGVPAPSTSSSLTVNREKPTILTAPSMHDDFNADIDSSSEYPETWGVSQPESDNSDLEAPMGGFVRKPKEGFARKPKDTTSESLMRGYAHEENMKIAPESLIPGSGPFSSSPSISEPPDAVQSDIYVTPNKGKTASSLRASSFFGNLYTSWRTVDFKEIPSGGAETAVDTTRRHRAPAGQPFPPADFSQPQPQRPPMGPRQQQHMPAPHMRQGSRENRFLPPQAGRMYPGPASSAIQSMQRPGFRGAPPGGEQQYYPPGLIHPQQGAAPAGRYDPSMMEVSSAGWSFDRRYASFKGSGPKKHYQTVETTPHSNSNNMERASAYPWDRRGDPRAPRHDDQDMERSGYPPMPAEEAYSRTTSTPPLADANQADVPISSFDRRNAFFRSDGRKQTQTRGMPPPGARNMERPSYPTSPVEDPYQQDDMYDGYSAMGRSAGPGSTNFASRYASFKSTDLKNPQNSGRRNIPVEQGGNMSMGRGAPPKGPQMPGPGDRPMGRNMGTPLQGPQMPGPGSRPMGRNMGAPPQGSQMPGPGSRPMGRNVGTPLQGPQMPGPGSRPMGRNMGAPPQGSQMPGPGSRPMGRNMGASPQGSQMPRPGSRPMGRNMGAPPQGPQMPGPGSRRMGRNMGAPPQGHQMPGLGDRPVGRYMDTSQNHQMPGTGGRPMERSSGIPQGPPPRGFSNDRYNPSQRFGNSRTHAEYHRMLMEIQQHLELLREFEDIIPPREMERRKRELFLSLPPPLAANFDSLNTPPDDMRRPPSNSSFSSRYNSFRSGESNPYNRPY